MVVVVVVVVVVVMMKTFRRLFKIPISAGDCAGFKTFGFRGGGCAFVAVVVGVVVVVAVHVAIDKHEEHHGRGGHIDR